MKESIYVEGDIVTYKGINYRAKWWNKGAVPDVSQAWETIGGRAGSFSSMEDKMIEPSQVE
ncbi:carbohydrate-binding protein [Enterococcus durans]|uniref:carbohydrate-binding protein n=1 Tax=Enterococcus durans TaxID=53345 RepID=UPI00164ACF90|nr:carbohydrate-binding protein [Enterococcus durans]